MKVLFASLNKVDNPFVFTLKKGIENLGCYVNWGLDEFWTNYLSYDIIHINWPDALFESWSPTKIEVLFLERIIKELKDKSKKIIYTRHNERPHYSDNENVLRCYQIIEQNADAIVHLGNYGVDELQKHLNCKHYIIPHHIYDTIYSNNITKVEARNKLRISQKKNVFLTFGAYRNKKEMDMILSAYKRLKIKNKCLLAPQLYYSQLEIKRPTSLKSKRIWIKYIIQTIKSRIKQIVESKRYSIVGLKGFVSDDDLPLYFSASDVILIQRNKILNSGNLPMAYYFKKMVVGPNVGNVGEIITKTKNLSFEPNNEDSLVYALTTSTNIVKKEIEEHNYNYAIKFWNTDKIAREYLDVYKSLLNWK